VAGVVLVSAFVREHGTPLQRALNAALYAVIFAGPWGPVLWRSYFPTFYPTRKPDDFASYVTGLERMLRQPGKLHAMRRMMLTRSNTESQLARLHAPALVVMGTRDPDFKPSSQAEAEWIAAQVQGSVQMIEGAGHYPHVEFPDETTAAIIAFLDGVAKREGVYSTAREDE
jgi:pimeloyl-ACP methyl ester carboxylesterase